MDTNIEGIERATLDAVAPPRLETLQHWLLPLDRSTIGRAISAVPLRHDELAIGDIDRIERIYAQAGLQARFRLADMPGLQDFQLALRAKGYQPRETTLTQTVSIPRLLETLDCTTTDQVQLSTQPEPAWQSVYLAPCFDAQDGANRIQALSRSSHVVYAWVSGTDCPLASGTASLSHGWLGFHGMRTVTAARRKGLAKKLIARLASFGHAQGYTQAYLQVHESSKEALALYQRMGFQTAWQYHYWVRSD